MRGTLHALKFISGKYTGGIFPLKPNHDFVIGRSSNLDMVLVEDMVSRRHAVITTRDAQVSIQDLGSTNGTFVNGERINKARLQEGDRVLIGTSIIKLVRGDEAEAAAKTTQPNVQFPGPGRQPRRTFPNAGARSMQGTIDEIPLPDLLQLLSTSRKSGVLQITRNKQVGRIYMREGQIFYATLDETEESFEQNPRKTLYRMLVWETGTFELLPPDSKRFMDELDEPTEGLLMEAMRQIDEIRRMEEEVLKREDRVTLAHPLKPKLSSLSPEQLDLLQVAHNEELVTTVLDQIPRPDLQAFEDLVQLLQDGYIEVKK